MTDLSSLFEADEWEPTAVRDVRTFDPDATMPYDVRDLARLLAECSALELEPLTGRCATIPP